MENIVNIQDHQEPGYPAMAAEKIAAELKSFTGGSKEKAISKFAAETLAHFCEESPQFAQVVYKTRRTLSDCCAEVMKGTGNYVSDIDVYRGIVRAYFPNADVKFLMNIEINGAAPSEEEMAKLPERPKPKTKAKPASKKPAEKAAAPAPAKSAPKKKPQEPVEKTVVPALAKPEPKKRLPEPETIQLTLF